MNASARPTTGLASRRLRASAAALLAGGVVLPGSVLLPSAPADTAPITDCVIGEVYGIAHSVPVEGGVILPTISASGSIP